MFFVKKYKMAASIAVSKKKMFGGRLGQEVLKIEIEKQIFLIFIKLSSEVSKIIKKYSFLQKW